MNEQISYIYLQKNSKKIVKQIQFKKMIIINPKTNHKLLQTFNNDPFSNITIQCQNQTLNLALSYLSIDSEYFDRVDADCKSINLSHLSEKPLIKILRALYGQKLKTNTIAQLKELYKIIEFLEITQYKQNIIDYIQAHQGELMNQLELLEFCYRNDMLQSQIRYYHFQRKLSLLSDSKNYLKLNKISQETLNNILLQYYQMHDDQKQSSQQIINSILENYFGRNQIKPNQYFNHTEVSKNQGLLILQAIWEKYHHPISYIVSAKEAIKNSQMINNNNNGAAMNHTFGHMSFAGYSQDINQSQFALNATSMPNFGSTKKSSNYSTYYAGTPKSTKIASQQTRKSGFMSSSYISSNFTQEMAKKDILIADLQRQLELKNQIILSLKAEIQNAKRQEEKNTLIPGSSPIKIMSKSPRGNSKLNLHKNQGQTNKNNQLLDSAEYYDIEQSILEDVKKSRKNLNSPLNAYNGQYDTSMIQPAFDQARMLNAQQQKQVKTMAKLNARGGNKRIFN